MLLQTVGEAQTLWRQVLACCDDLTRRGLCGPDLLRLASQLRVPLEAFLQTGERQHQALQRHVQQCLAWFKRCEELYQALYVDAYAALDRIPAQGQTTRRATVNDGHARHAVPLDPDSAFNTVCRARWSASRCHWRTTHCASSPASSLANTPNAAAKVDALWQRYEREAQQLHADPVMALPTDCPGCDVSALASLEEQLLLIQSVLLSLYRERQQSQEDDLTEVYGHCSELQLQLERVVARVNDEVRNGEVWRDNVLVKFFECSQLITRLTQTYELHQAQRPLVQGHLANIF